MHGESKPTDRQLDILQFLDLIGPSEEGDVAYCLRLEPRELYRVPAAFADLPGEYVARRELERLKDAGLVSFDGVVWSITPAAKHLLREGSGL